jgi:hypothetical protein
MFAIEEEPFSAFNWLAYFIPSHAIFGQKSKLSAYFSQYHFVALTMKFMMKLVKIRKKRLRKNS